MSEAFCLGRWGRGSGRRGGFRGKKALSEAVNWYCCVNFRASPNELSKVMSVNFPKGTVNC